MYNIVTYSGTLSEMPNVTKETSGMSGPAPSVIEDLVKIDEDIDSKVAVNALAKDTEKIVIDYDLDYDLGYQVLDRWDASYRPPDYHTREEFDIMFPRKI